MSKKPQSKRGRPPSPERTAATRQSLLDASVECLVERGWAGTSLPAIVHRAGVSRGAQQYHFATKADLIEATGGHLADKLAAEFAEILAGQPESEQTLGRYVDVMWALLHGRTFLAVVELGMGSRADARMGSPVSAIVDSTDAMALALVEERVIGRLHDGELQAAVRSAMSLLVGMAILDIFDTEHSDDRLKAFTRFRRWVANWEAETDADGSASEKA